MGSNVKIKSVLFILFILAASFLTYKYLGVSDVKTKTEKVTLASCLFKAPDSTLSIKDDSILGSFYGDGKCMTLYVYNNDKPNESTCYNDCSKIWIPYLKKEIPNTLSYPEITSDLSDDPSLLLTTFKRTDGTLQYAINGHPLYYFNGDRTINDTKGNGLEDGGWVVVQASLSSLKIKFNN